METIFGEVEVLPDEKSDGMKAIEIFRRTSQDIRELDFVTKEKAQALVHYLTQNVAINLAENNIPAVMDTMGKMEAAEKYVRNKVSNHEGDRVAANTITAGRLWTAREIGEWLVIHLAERHQHKSAWKDDGELIRHHIVVWRDDIEEWGISPDMAEWWQRFAKVEEAIFSNWIKERLQDDTGVDLYYSHALYEFASVLKSKRAKASKRKEMSLSPAGQSLYKAQSEYRDALARYVTKAGKNPPPRREIAFLVDQVIQTQHGEEGFKKMVGELA